MVFERWTRQIKYFKTKTIQRTCWHGYILDSEFASGWGTEEGINTVLVKVHTGFAIEVISCPVTLCSKLKISVVTSAMESEYTAL